MIIAHITTYLEPNHQPTAQQRNTTTTSRLGRAYSAYPRLATSIPSHLQHRIQLLSSTRLVNLLTGWSIETSSSLVLCCRQGSGGHLGFCATSPNIAGQSTNKSEQDKSTKSGYHQICVWICYLGWRPMRTCSEPYRPYHHSLEKRRSFTRKSAHETNSKTRWIRSVRSGGARLKLLCGSSSKLNPSTPESFTG